MPIEKIPFIDIFSGAGGLSCGFEQSGFQSVFALDNDKFACESFAVNHPKAKVFNCDVEGVKGRDILKATGRSEIPLVIGGPNCQGVSLRGKRNPNDPKNKMFNHFYRLIKELKPGWFVMENVPGLLHRHNDELVTDIFKTFSDLGYNCGGEVLCAADYGAPQIRYRFILVGNRLGLPNLLPNATHRFVPSAAGGVLNAKDARPAWLTARDAIGDLPRITNGGGEGNIPYPDTKRQLTEYQQLSRRGSARLYNHECHKTPDHNIALIRHIPPGKNWKSIPERLRPSRFQYVALKDHTTTYGRLSWDMTGRTITTYFNNISSGAFTHPNQDRGISVREGARFQSFPDRYRFVGPLSRQYRQVGNAVPPRLAQQVAKVIFGMMSKNPALYANAHAPAVEYSRSLKKLIRNRPLQGMRFNLDKYLVTA